MKNVVILGAGRSSYALIGYLLKHSIENDWQIEVGDLDISLAQEKIKNHQNATAFQFDVSDVEACRKIAQRAGLVISLLPAFLHAPVAEVCVQESTSIFTASYVSPQMQELDGEAKQKGLLLLNEIGLDPGIDHLSAMQVLDRIRLHNSSETEKAEITAFRSFTGGLLAPQSDNNPWNYKFTWNPRNVVLAGQGTAKFIQNHQYKYAPYHRLFSYCEPIESKEFAQINKDDENYKFEGYPNRDSLQYRSTYGLDDIPTMLRGTIRRDGFCKSWDTFIQLGMTDDSYKIEHSDKLTYRQFANMFFKYDPFLSLEKKLKEKYNFCDAELKKWEYLGFFEDKKITLPNASPAQILQHLLEEKWTLDPQDKDMILMQHRIKYTYQNKAKELTSSLVVFGDDSKHTAMAKTVGLPLAIAAKLYLTGNLHLKGVQIPIHREIYEPVLAELENHGIIFKEEITEIDKSELYS
ncbi:saccharopine dehydrogenase C-terminal domain-containing protein [Bernardetia sp. ABR2-2B]|uniref:saccharopine dehydrogenase family protein n=1 Tax=Bernardetia sp. ABR2-2B TaxID=3127472 RepID=UPI0030CADF6F